MSQPKIIVELRTMPRPISEDDLTLYLVLEDFGPLGRAFLETDLAEADRKTIIGNFISGQYQNALRVISLNIGEGWSRDVSEDIAVEIIDRAYDAEDTLTEGTKRFIDRHLDGERRPPATSMRRGNETAGKKVG
jgi:hypothetical protein